MTKAFEGLLKALLQSDQRIAACGRGFAPLVIGSFRRRYLAIVGTMVRERKYDASMANTTASASGTKRYRATPVSRNIGANTMQIDSVETKAGVAICDALSRTTSSMSLSGSSGPVAVDVLDFHRGIIHQDSNRERQSAQRHDVDGFPQRAEER